jgi:Ca2+-binding RTX toxin-like protein
MRFNFGGGPSLIDTITDFDWQDKIDLSHIDANTNLAGNQAFHFGPGSSYTGEAGELLVTRTIDEDVQDVYLVQGDINGDARMDFMIEVHAYSQSLSFIF